MNTPKPKLLDQVRGLIRLRHMSYKTERAYVAYIRDYLLFHNKRHPSEMGANEIRSYLTHLAVDKNVAASTQNVAFYALLVLYKQVLGIRLENFKKRRKIRSTVFSNTSIWRVNLSDECCSNPTNAH